MNTNKIQFLAQKYYGTQDLSKLLPYQLDKVVGWAMKMDPNKGKNQTKKAQQALAKGRKFKSNKRWQGKQGTI